MKTPSELAERLARQWQQADVREARLLGAEGWPLRLAIGKPPPEVFANQPESIRLHLQRWREVRVGSVIWEPVPYRAAAEPVAMPLAWELRRPSEWVAATGDAQVQAEYAALGRLLRVIAEPAVRVLLVRQRRLVLERPAAEVVKAVEVAAALAPGCAMGRPLRALGLCNIDSKFFERHRALLLPLLDLRFAGQVSEQGLEAFLDAAQEGEHWLLLAALAPDLLPFSQMRVRASELRVLPASISHVLIVENERCLHQLPPLPGTLAILGAGLNLEWMRGDALARRRVAYWGDMDTWGLSMLARARQFQPAIQPVLMGRACFDRYASLLAVVEPRPCEAVSGTLERAEQDFHGYLCRQVRGRLEQEFLPGEEVAEALRVWHNQE
ncbi:Wadjet anti-phage system protein JetD domain-containing protein [Pseudomonas nicosulfuronedens]